jgi:hypothetical protein
MPKRASKSRNLTGPKKEKSQALKNLTVEFLQKKGLVETVPKKRSHPWRLCPAGQHWVKTHDRKVSVSSKNPNGFTEVEGHCRINPSGKDQIYPIEIDRIAKENFSKLKDPIGKYPKLFRERYDGNAFDSIIVGWTKYWNKVLKPKEPLSPNFVKALIASESSFNPDEISPKTKAAGLMQLLPETIPLLSDEGGELKDHFVNLDQEDAFDPNVAICAGIRWLFRKKRLASIRLKREASWEEAIAEYKSYLKDIIKNKDPNHRGMGTFRKWLKDLQP